MPTRRTADDIAEIVVDRLGWQKLSGNSGLTDFDPLVVVMRLIASEIGEEKLFTKSKARAAWLKAMALLQGGDGLEHNSFLPCRTCDQAFDPVIDETLLTLFLDWYQHGGAARLIAIHKCPACGGQIKARRTRTYKGDMHTPPPGTVEGDDQWVEELLQHSMF